MSNQIINNSHAWDYGWSESTSYKTDISQLSGGGEQRRARWEQPIRKFKLPFNNKYIADLKALMQFFRDHKGQYESFYFYNPNGRVIETIDSNHKEAPSNIVDHIHLRNSPVFNASVRPFAVSASTAVADYNIVITVAGTPRTTNMTIDSANGVIYFTSNKPAKTDVITVEYDYLIKVRFATDMAEYSETTYNVGSASIEITETR